MVRASVRKDKTKVLTGSYCTNRRTTKEHFFSFLISCMYALSAHDDIFHITNDIFRLALLKLNYGTTHNISDLSYTCLDTLYSSSYAYSSQSGTTKAQASLRKCTGSPEPLLRTFTKYRCR